MPIIYLAAARNLRLSAAIPYAMVIKIGSQKNHFLVGLGFENANPLKRSFIEETPSNTNPIS